jgi:hypothetical protein
MSLERKMVKVVIKVKCDIYKRDQVRKMESIKFFAYPIKGLLI